MWSVWGGAQPCGRRSLARNRMARPPGHRSSRPGSVSGGRRRRARSAGYFSRDFGSSAAATALRPFLPGLLEGRNERVVGTREGGDVVERLSRDRRRRRRGEHVAREIQIQRLRPAARISAARRRSKTSALWPGTLRGERSPPACSWRSTGRQLVLPEVAALARVLRLLGIAEADPPLLPGGVHALRAQAGDELTHPG